MPWRIIEIDQIDGGYAGLQIRYVVVRHDHFITRKFFGVAESLSRTPNDVGQPACGLSFPLDVEILVPDHIDENHRFQIIYTAIANTTVDIVAAAINAIVIGPFDDCLLTVEKNEFESVL